MKGIRQLFNAALMGASLATLGTSSAAFAATATVLVGSGGNVFTPAITNIAVNDRVIWSWSGFNHNVTSTNSAWTASATQSTPATFTNTFTAAGNYFYFCTIHGTPTSGMKGESVVAGANVPPTVSITNPVPNEVFAATANVTIQAAAADSDGAVTNVQFLNGATSLGNVTAAPYSAVASSLAAGSYTLFAIASDNGGAKATNSVSISVVNPVPIVLSAAAAQPAGGLHFSFTANSGLSYVAQRSTNIVSSSWIPFVTNLAGSSSVTVTDFNATLNPGFYRVMLVPNP